ncbi:MAG: V-type ATP synthase subunit I [Treponema sp.]|nr:V-type ATP synthase subunit I [Treponema sp.]
MFLPRKMLYMELTVFKEDMDAVLNFLGRKASIQFPGSDIVYEGQDVLHIRDLIERLYSAGDYLGVVNKNTDLSKYNDEVSIPGKEGEAAAISLCSIIESMKDREYKASNEKQRIKETINEVKAFSKMNVPFSDFEHLSYLTLRVGRLDPNGISQLRENMGNRAVIISLDDDDRILAASSKKGRFALDTQLKKAQFEPVELPQKYLGIPAEILKRLIDQFFKMEKEIESIKEEKAQLAKRCALELKKHIASWRIAMLVEEIKARFTTTTNLYHFSGWTPADSSSLLVRGLNEITNGRIAVRSFLPDEVPAIQSGKEKVPVSMKHNAFVRGFESVVFSYGAPLYGTVDPTVLVAFFFTLMFGIMFGDAGQGFVLLLLGIIIKTGGSKLSKLKKYSTVLVSVGISSMIMGFLAGSVFTNEKILIGPTRAVTEALFGYPKDRILHILPLAEEGGSITKLLYFFGFTIAIGVVINSLGLIINIYNRIILKKYKTAFFSRTGLSGLLLFWYALFVVIKILFFNGQFETHDVFALLVPLLFILFGPAVYGIVSGEKPSQKEGVFAFVMQGFVEILETVSGYFSNTISFVRVGAFALAHAVFSFIVFYFTDKISGYGIGASFLAAFIFVFGNAIIIALEGLIVTIQVIRLQYYEFFNKFLLETGVEFAPFRINYKERI